LELLNQRLLKIAECLSPCDCLCDIGTDHAFIPIFALENKIAKRAIASDIKRGPLKIAQKNIELAGLNKEISIVQSNGFENFREGDFDVAVIAGMGGHLIIDIISNHLAVAKSCDKIILQPMNDLEFCRVWLFFNGFDIIEELIALDSSKPNKLYVVIVARTSKTPVDFVVEDVLIGPCLKNGQDPMFRKHIAKIVNKRKKRIAGLKESGSVESLETLQTVEDELDIIQRWVSNL